MRPEDKSYNLTDIVSAADCSISTVGEDFEIRDSEGELLGRVRHVNQTHWLLLFYTLNVLLKNQLETGKVYGRSEIQDGMRKLLNIPDKES